MLDLTRSGLRDRAVQVLLDPDLALREQPQLGHNRWHPELTPVAEVEPGDGLTLELRDSMDGQVTPESTHDDLLDLVAVSHVLTGPVAVRGAEPGDLLELDILGYTTAAFGWTTVLPEAGMLGDLVERPYLVRWQLADGVARSDDLPGVAIPASIHAGVIGVTPSQELFDKVLKRELLLADAGYPVRLPEADTAFPDAAQNGLRTMPPRENGGNLDVRDLTAGARPSASRTGAGCAPLCGRPALRPGRRRGVPLRDRDERLRDLPGGAAQEPQLVPRFPAHEAPPRRPRAAFATTGIPLTDEGDNAWLDVGLAARRALLELTAWLRSERGYGFEQACALASVACELRISQAVDLPNPLVSAALPLEVFD
jgi:formamidase